MSNNKLAKNIEFIDRLLIHCKYELSLIIETKFNELKAPLSDINAIKKVYFYNLRKIKNVHQKMKNIKKNMKKMKITEISVYSQHLLSMTFKYKVTTN